jgi:hypothetical protein
MKAICELLLLFQNLLLVSEAVTESNILETILMNFLILKSVHFLPFVEHLFGDLLSRAGEDSILGN